MSEEDNAPVQVGQALPKEQVAKISGGDGSCTTVVTIGGPGGSVSSTYNSLGEALIGTYEGIVDATSYVMERVITSTKPS